MSSLAADSPRVLIVDDDPFVCQLVALLIERVGLIPVVAHSARRALEVAANQVLGLVITDIQMPGASGIALCSDLQVQHPELPVLAMSGSGPVHHNEALQDAMKAGARAILAKPFKLDEFYSAVASAVSTPHV